MLLAVAVAVVAALAIGACDTPKPPKASPVPRLDATAPRPLAR